jgi:hypothetical protein
MNNRNIWCFYKNKPKTRKLNMFTEKPAFSVEYARLKIGMICFSIFHVFSSLSYVIRNKYVSIGEQPK